MMDIDTARKFLRLADVFFGAEDEDDPEDRFRQMLNMNDVWAWALADGEPVSDEELPEVANLFWKYGWCGILYWVSQKNNGMRSEFLDNNRFIDFVAHEEKLREEEPSDSKRAYHRLVYSLGDNDELSKEVTRLREVLTNVIIEAKISNSTLSPHERMLACARIAQEGLEK